MTLLSSSSIVSIVSIMRTSSFRYVIYNRTHKGHSLRTT
ncbi:hypothetical protein LEP1GSC047_2377 [Leptospira inadai serovar Lyme str. 10]|uniref:Uncharacterized protein n=1 Tax=Leptospira inadai serovar Lyme str. 10 TaxID=1049790 RepID=V6HFI9_9LEPT|nr:hypothetical protein LEP1GSC047_2377 [Leptospira inadai serovar Lyme str. 10]